MVDLLAHDAEKQIDQLTSQRFSIAQRIIDIWGSMGKWALNAGNIAQRCYVFSIAALSNLVL